MGKTWKFITSSKDRPKSPKVHEDYQWSTQSFTLKEIVSSFKLPTIVLCNVESCTVLWSNFYFELKQPLLLYSRRQVRKACAWCLRKNQETGRYTQSGPSVVIPEDYDGWFQLIYGENDRPFQFNSIEAIALSLTENFLCATESQAFKVSSKPDGTFQFAQRTITAGEVLKKLGVYTGDVPKPKENQVDGIELIEMKYLKCTDEKGDELVIPFVQTGKFYAVSFNISYNSGLVQVREIVSKDNELPVFAQHVYGDPPALSYNYTGQLQFYDYIQEETVMAATLTKDRVRPLEIQMDSVIRFRIALNEAQVRPRSEFIKALQLCQRMGQKYVRDMKIAFTLTPATTSLENIDLSIYNMSEHSLRQSSSLEMDSDLGEAIDANSEFEIDWGPPYSCDNENKQESAPMASDSQVRYDEVGHYVENINAALDDEETDKHVTQNDISVCLHRSCNGTDGTDGTDDTDIFYGDEYIENHISLDEAEKGKSCNDLTKRRSQIMTDCQDTCEQIADEPETNTENNLETDTEVKHDVYDCFDEQGGPVVDECDTDDKVATYQHGMSVYHDDTGYESDRNRKTDKYVEETLFIYKTGADKEKLRASSDKEMSSDNNELYDSIEVESLVIVEGSVYSDNDKAREQYEWGDEFV